MLWETSNWLENDKEVHLFNQSDAKEKFEEIFDFLTIQKMLKEKGKGEDEIGFRRKLLELSLKHSLLTPSTSLVVSKPDGKYILEIKPADKKGFNFGCSLECEMYYNFYVIISITNYKEARFI